MDSQPAIRGYWHWTWHRSDEPQEINLSIAFSGWNDIQNALSQSKQVYPQLAGEKFICIGGGNKNGAFTASVLDSLTSAIDAGTFAGYQGIAYDIEVGDSGLSDAFAASFLAAKRANLKVLVTISHSAPYGIGDAYDLMHSLFKDDNIDILSPQLYTTGKETENNYATSHGIDWSDYGQCKAAIAPSVVSAALFESAKEYFAEQKVELAGYIQWRQNG